MQSPLKLAIGVLIVILIYTSIASDSVKNVSIFPEAIQGMWVYETGGEDIDGCNTSRILVDSIIVILVEECAD